jgi:hypothetical protein
MDEAQALEMLQEFSTELLDLAAHYGEPLVIEIRETGLVIALPQAVFEGPEQLQEIQNLLLQVVKARPAERV